MQQEGVMESQVTSRSASELQRQEREDRLGCRGQKEDQAVGAAAEDTAPRRTAPTTRSALDPVASVEPRDRLGC